MKQSLRSSRNICRGDLTDSEYDAQERYRAEKRENIHVKKFKKKGGKRGRWRRRRAKQPGIPTWLERDKHQLEDQELAQIYEELMSTNYDPPCTTEDASTYEYLESYWYKQD